MYKLLSRQPGIKAPNLLKEMTRLGLGRNSFDDILEQAFIQNTTTGNKFNALCMDNMAGGVEIMSFHHSSQHEFAEPLTLKTCIGQKAPTIYHAHPDCEELHCRVFADMIDYAIYRSLSGKQKFNETCIIYHEDSRVSGAGGIIVKNDRIKHVEHYHQHDPNNAGYELTNVTLSDYLDGHPLTHGTMEHLYKPHTSLAQGHMRNRNALVKAMGVTPQPGPRKPRKQPLMKPRA